MSSNTAPPIPDATCGVDTDHAIVPAAIQPGSPGDNVLTFGKLSEGRRNNFDLIRFLLASLVIFSHSHPLSGQNAREPLYVLSGGQIDLGKVAVDGFFLISGFLITQSWLRSRSAGDYLKKRALRIYPGFVVALLFGALFAPGLGGLHFPGYLRQHDVYRAIYSPLLFGNNTIVAGAFPRNAFKDCLNGSIWTIRYEIGCYVLLPVLAGVAALRRRGAAAALLGGVLIVCNVGTLNILARISGSLFELPRLLVYFLAGLTFYLYRDRIPYSRALLAGSLLLLAVTARHGLGWTLPICGAYVLFYGAFSPKRSFADFARRGDLSYGVYLYAYPIQQILVYHAGDRLNPVTLTLAALPPTYALAALSWRFVEQPFLKRKPRPAVGHAG